MGIVRRDARHAQQHLGQVRGRRVAVEIRAGEPQLQQGRQGSAQGGQDDDRIGDGEPAGGEALFQVAYGARGQAPAGMDVSEAAMAQHLHQFRMGVGHAGAEPDPGRDKFGGIVDAPQVLVEGLAGLLQPGNPDPSRRMTPGALPDDCGRMSSGRTGE